MKKILAIGNSFSEDATKFLHPLAESAGVDTKVVNIYVGGCSLEKHWAHIQQHAAPYQVQINGTITERHASIRERRVPRLKAPFASGGGECAPHFP